MPPPPEGLTPFGRIVESLRSEGGLSRAGLARRIGVSRVQLWRAITGRTRLTDGQLYELAAVLGLPVARLLRAVDEDASIEPDSDAPEDSEIENYLSNLGRILVTLRNFPGGEMGLRLKLAYLNGVEEIAREVGQKLPPRYWDVRRRVQEGEVI